MEQREREREPRVDATALLRAKVEELRDEAMDHARAGLAYAPPAIVAYQTVLALNDRIVVGLALRDLRAKVEALAEGCDGGYVDAIYAVLALIDGAAVSEPGSGDCD